MFAQISGLIIIHPDNEELWLVSVKKQQEFGFNKK